MNTFIEETLERYGASIDKVRLFDKDKWQLLPYATLGNARRRSGSELAALYGVYEWQENPLVFLINGEQLKDDDSKHFQRIRRMVAMRGDAPYIGVAVRTGQLTVHRLSLDDATQEQSRITELDNHQPELVFSYLINERPGLESARQAWISDVILKLLREAIDNLIKADLGKKDAISLAGRTLFTRFLVDRDLLCLPLPGGSVTDADQLFSNPQDAKVTSEWLDKTFNGDFLPFDSSAFKSLSSIAYDALNNIMFRTPGGQLHLDWKEDWAHLDFAHIPVGVLSQAYEQYMRNHDDKKQKKEGSYYTPRRIVELMSSAAFHALRREGNAHEAKVLDPAAGAGVFLISAFRHLVAERWKYDDKYPETPILREILYKQICGFDINEEALRFAALGLYLISIELDPHPAPVEKLRFDKDLGNRVLFKLPADEKLGSGSLGYAVSDDHREKYDLVIGNPPWPTGTAPVGWKKTQEIIARIAKKRLPDQPAPPIPKQALDQPFIWRAMEWARPGGQIAFALHARLLFQQKSGMPRARQAVFDALDVTGIINGVELRQTKVWPEIDAPFCLLFANNSLPSFTSGFRFVTPHLEDSLNQTGYLRVDASNAEMLTVQQIKEHPEIFKILFRGTRLDLEVFERISSRNIHSLEDYWKQLFGIYRNKPKQAGNGYKRPYDSKNPKDTSKSAPHLTDLPDLESRTFPVLPLLIDTKRLLRIDENRRFSRPRSREIYNPPLLIIKQTPYTNTNRIKLSISTEDVVFSETYYGYSAAGHANASELICYLALLIGSKPAFWYILMSSGKFGVEREVVEKFIIDNVPVIPLEELESSSREQIEPLFNALAQEDSEENWKKADAWAAELFGLNQDDLQVISDTLRYCLPFSRNKKLAQLPATEDEISLFCDLLRRRIAPWAEDEQLELKVYPVTQFFNDSWTLLRIETNLTSPQAVDNWHEILRIANQLGTTEVFQPDADKKGLWIARLKQARYWNRSQVRLVVRRIIWEHMEIFARENNTA